MSHLTFHDENKHFYQVVQLDNENEHILEDYD